MGRDPDDAVARRAASFGSVAWRYDRARQDYPADAVRDLLGGAPRDVLDVGAGTGKLTRVVAAAGHRVIAVDPSVQMLAVLTSRSPDARAVVGMAEDLPLQDASVDAVVVGQARHWFDVDRSNAQIRRVLRPSGAVGLFWNMRERTADWVEEYDHLVGAEDSGPPVQPPSMGAGFTALALRSYPHEAVVDLAGFLDLARSRSRVAIMDDAERRRVLEDVQRLGEGLADAAGRITIPMRCDVWQTHRD